MYETLHILPWLLIRLVVGILSCAQRFLSHFHCSFSLVKYARMYHHNYLRPSLNYLSQQQSIYYKTNLLCKHELLWNCLQSLYQPLSNQRFRILYSYFGLLFALKYWSLPILLYILNGVLLYHLRHCEMLCCLPCWNINRYLVLHHYFREHSHTLRLYHIRMVQPRLTK